MRINKFLPFAIIYFFFNSVGLPMGLTYTALLSPLLYWWVINTRGKEFLLPFFVVLFPFIFVHVNIVGVDSNIYKRSLLNLAAVYIFCQAFYTFLKTCIDPEKIFRKILIINLVLCLVAIPFYFTEYYELFWIKQSLTEGVENVKRLKLFTYEASYYATLFTPLFFYFLLQIFLRQNKMNSWILFLLLILPLILSFSIGVIGTLFFSVCIVLIVYFRSLLPRWRVVHTIVLALLAAVPTLFILGIFFPDNALFTRVINIVSGHDASGRGRTNEAFILADLLLDQKSQTWGVGLGQIKVMGSDIIRDFYMYGYDNEVIAIPNATAETLAVFGWIGLCMRFVAEIFLFFRTRVWTNYFRMLLFVFMFIYQFTGSFITNLAEYVIWIFAFTEVFPQFRVKTHALNSKLSEGI
jgi:hypothetical protein